MISILSWNIFADPQNMEFRTTEIAKCVSALLPDVICFQEVLYQSSLILKDGLKDHYDAVYDNPYVNNTSGRVYGEMVFTKRCSVKVINKFFITLYSSQGRTATFIDIIVGDRQLRVSTAHLESGTSCEKTRDIQLESIKTNLTPCSWLWIGDSNYSSENEWFSDIGSNPTWFENRFWKGTRTASYDKVSSDQTLCKVEFIGDKMVSGKWLSDHNGLLVAI